MNCRSVVVRRGKACRNALTELQAKGTLTSCASPSAASTPGPASRRPAAPGGGSTPQTTSEASCSLRLRLVPGTCRDVPDHVAIHAPVEKRVQTNETASSPGHQPAIRLRTFGGIPIGWRSGVWRVERVGPRPHTRCDAGAITAAVMRYPTAGTRKDVATAATIFAEIKINIRTTHHWTFG